MPETTAEHPILVVARVAEMLRGEMRTHTWWHAADFASQAAQQFLAACPDPSDGERAAGVRDGLEMASRMVLALARVPKEDHDARARIDDSGEAL